MSSFVTIAQLTILSKNKRDFNSDNRPCYIFDRRTIKVFLQFRIILAEFSEYCETDLKAAAFSSCAFYENTKAQSMKISTLRMLRDQKP